MKEIAKPREGSHENTAVNIGLLSIRAHSLTQLLGPVIALKAVTAAAKLVGASVD